MVWVCIERQVKQILEIKVKRRRGRDKLRTTCKEGIYCEAGKLAQKTLGQMRVMMQDRKEW